MPRYITEKGVRGRYYSRLEQYMAGWIDRVSVRFDSDEAVEDYAWLGTPPGFSEHVGERHVERLREAFYQIRNREYDAGLAIPRKLIERDKTTQVESLIDDFAVRCGGHWTELLSTLILAGTGETLGNCYDGQYFFDDDHSEGDSGTQTNLLTSSEVAALNVTTAAVPTPVEAAKAILGVIAYMMTYKDDHGKVMNAAAREFLVMTSPVLWQYLAPAVYNATVNGGETNPAAAIIANSNFKIDVVPNPLLTYTTQFVTFRTDAPLKPLIRQDEVDTDLEIVGVGSEHWTKNHEMLVSAYARRAVGFGRWQSASLSTLS